MMTKRIVKKLASACTKFSRAAGTELKSMPLSLSNVEYNRINKVELKSMSLLHLENIVSKDSDKYMELFKKKCHLEDTFNNKSLDAKTRCEAYQKLSPMLNSFYKFEKEYIENLKMLKSRLVSSMTEEQLASHQARKLR